MDAAAAQGRKATKVEMKEKLLIAVENDLISAVEKSYASVKKVHFDNAFYRNDIGAKALKVLKEGN